jgi:hypothetical protein
MAGAIHGERVEANFFGHIQALGARRSLESILQGRLAENRAKERNCPFSMARASMHERGFRLEERNGPD